MKLINQLFNSWINPSSSPNPEDEAIADLIGLTNADQLLWQDDHSKTSDMGFSAYLIKCQDHKIVLGRKFLIRWSFGGKASLFVDDENNHLPEVLLSRREKVKDLALAAMAQLARADLDNEFRNIIRKHENTRGVY